MKKLRGLLIIAPVWLATQMASATPRQQPYPEIFADLLECRDITNEGQRLACFDQRVAAMETASQRDEVVVLDKSELQKTRRTLFGFSFPKLPFLGGGGDKEEQDESLSRIEATIASVRSLGYGKWQINLDDGAQWATTEAVTYGAPGAGMKIEIKRASMGSFMGKFEGGRAVRMKRVG